LNLPDFVTNDTDTKRFSIVSGHMSVELRPLQALTLMRDFSLAEVRDDAPDLSTRQMSILLTIYLEAPPHTIRGLAARLGVTKPVITRALDTMGTMGLVERHRDEKDKRNVLVKRTVTGALYVERIGDRLIEKARELPR
jgi:DNA-binding MarR family transcriptional regulator